ncbi:MAG: exo-alpha-sialidase [Clostridia bacterium]|nr:exo-alpha-sialidase [Clostridia bacterium]
MALEKFIISRDDALHEAWPDVVLTKSGTLICIFTECSCHGDYTGARLMITRSYDKGRTWTPKTVFAECDNPEHYYDCVSIRRLSDDRIVVLIDKHEDEGEDLSLRPICMWIGDAEGETWSEEIHTPARGIVPDKLLELSGGRWIISAHYEGKASGKLEQYLWYSDDKGNSWTGPVTVAKDSRYNLCEASLIELKDGVLVAYLRENTGIGYECLKTISYDMGETWSEVYTTPIPCCHRPMAGFLDDGSIMITYRFMQGGKGWLGTWCQNVFAAFTDDDSARAKERNEQTARLFPLDFDRSPVSDLGYTGWVQFDDGEIYVVNYIVDDAPKAHIRGYSFTKDDVLITKD